MKKFISLGPPIKRHKNLGYDPGRVPANDVELRCAMYGGGGWKRAEDATA